MCSCLVTRGLSSIAIHFLSVEPLRKPSSSQNYDPDGCPANLNLFYIERAEKKNKELPA